MKVIMIMAETNAEQRRPFLVLRRRLQFLAEQRLLETSN
jgi:hypothetical protein